MNNREVIHALKRTYKNMIARCYEPLTTNYFRYGGRGIYVAEEWAVYNNGCNAFILWAINNGYEPGLTLDRIDNNGPYAPWNCRWTTMKVQSNNRRGNTIITYCGESHTMTEWADIINQPTLDAHKVSYRVRRHWPYEAALFLGDYQNPDDGPVYDIYGNAVELPDGIWLDKHKAYIARIKEQRKNGLGHVNENEFFGFDENGQYRTESPLPIKPEDLRNSDHKSTYTYRRPKKQRVEGDSQEEDESAIIEKALRAIWDSIRARCLDKHNPKYQFYGAKGITICKQWVKDFNAFKKWALPHYDLGYVLELAHGSNEYGPHQCLFVAPEDATRRAMTDTMKIRYRGKLYTLANLVKEMGTADYATTKYRLERGYGTAFALFAKPGQSPGGVLRNRDGFMVLNYNPGTDSSDLGKHFYIRMMNNKNKT